MAHTGHVYRVKANSQEEAIKRVERYLNGFNDSNIWHYIISTFDSNGKYTKIYQDKVENFPQTAQELDEFIINSLKPKSNSQEAYNLLKYGFNRETCPEINSRSIEAKGLTSLTTRCKANAKNFFVVTCIHA